MFSKIREFTSSISNVVQTKINGNSNPENKVIVVGVDPAPKSNTTIFSPNLKNRGFKVVSPSNVASALEYITSDDGYHLVCWDAPLTGPDLNKVRKYKPDRTFSQRPIEAFFAKSYKDSSEDPFGTHNVRGISVKAYCDCSHWTISQSVLGYPRTGCYSVDPSDLPFELQTAPVLALNGRSKKVVEVHPALALWLMQPEELRHERDFTYKGRGAHEDAKRWLFEGLQDFVEGDKDAASVVNQFRARELCDDKLDALTAWVLGKLWTKDPSKVRLLGDAANGTFLLPVVDGLEESYRAFVGK
jgi:predicted nuclease with RNAse H fold